MYVCELCVRAHVYIYVCTSLSEFVGGCAHIYVCARVFLCVAVYLRCVDCVSPCALHNILSHRMVNQARDEG